MSETITIPESKFLELNSYQDIVQRILGFKVELVSKLHAEQGDEDDKVVMVDLAEFIFRLDYAISGQPFEECDLPNYVWPHRPDDCDDRWSGSGCAECKAIEALEQPTTDSPCADGDFCKRVNGRIKHDQFCDAINHKDED